MLVTQPAPLLFMLRTTPFHFIQVSINVFPQGSHLLPYLPFPVTKTFFTSHHVLLCPAGTASCLSLELRWTHKTVYFILTKKGARS